MGYLVQQSTGKTEQGCTLQHLCFLEEENEYAIDMAYENMKKGEIAIQGRDLNSALSSLREEVDKDAPYGYSRVCHTYHKNVVVISEPIATHITPDELCYELEHSKKIIKVSPELRANLRGEKYWVDNRENFYLRERNWYWDIEYSPARARAKRKKGVYNRTTEQRYGRVPAWWFKDYQDLVHKHIDMPMWFYHGSWCTWRKIYMGNSGFMITHDKLKYSKCTCVYTSMREDPLFKDLLVQASWYIQGAELHKKDSEFFSYWAKQMKHECYLMNIPIRDTQKKKKGKSNDE